jgi:hypothetical protein
MTYFVYLNNGGYIVSKFKTEAEADNLIAANETGVMAKIAAPNDSDTVNYLKYLGGNFIAETLEDIAFENLANLRNDRNLKLAECDWTQSPDSPLSDSKKLEWALYRQQLRDFPSSNPDLANPIFPTKPE